MIRAVPTGEIGSTMPTDNGLQTDDTWFMLGASKNFCVKQSLGQKFWDQVDIVPRLEADVSTV